MLDTAQFSSEDVERLRSAASCFLWQWANTPSVFTSSATALGTLLHALRVPGPTCHLERGTEGTRKDLEGKRLRQLPHLE